MNLAGACEPDPLSVLLCSVRALDETSRTRGAVRAYVASAEQRDWQRLSDLLTENMVYELPQSRERIQVGFDAVQ